MIIDFYIGRVLMNIDNVLEKMTFEDAMNELESIVNALDKGDISLDKAIAAYDRGSKLKDHC
jgi:exodeoxyribonuclease VII small subunit